MEMYIWFTYCDEGYKQGVVSFCYLNTETEIDRTKPKHQSTNYF